MMSLLPLASKVPAMLKRAHATAAERKEMEEILLRALCRAMCPKDSANPEIVAYATEANRRLWERPPEEAEPTGRFGRLGRKLRVRLRKPESETTDWVRWRETMRAWVASAVDQDELEQALSRAECVDGNRDARKLAKGFAEDYIAELHSKPTPFRRKLRARALEADEHRVNLVKSEAVRRFGQVTVMTAVGALGLWEIAHLVDLDTLQDTLTAVFGGTVAAVAAGAATVRSRATMREAVQAWIARTLEAQDATQRAARLGELRARLIPLAATKGDAELMGAMEKAENALAALIEGHKADWSLADALDLIAALMELPPPPKADQPGYAALRSSPSLHQ